MAQATVREGMVDVYVALGRLKRRASRPAARSTEAPLTGAALVRAFQQINPSRVTAVSA